MTGRRLCHSACVGARHDDVGDGQRKIACSDARWRLPLEGPRAVEGPDQRMVQKAIEERIVVDKAPHPELKFSSAILRKSRDTLVLERSVFQVPSKQTTRRFTFSAIEPSAALQERMLSAGAAKVGRATGSKWGDHGLADEAGGRAHAAASDAGA